MTCPRCQNRGWFRVPNHRGEVEEATCPHPNQTAWGFVGLFAMACFIYLIAMWWPR